MIQHIREIDNVRVNALSKRSNYETYLKIIKSMLIKIKENLKLTKATKENENIIS